MTRSAIRRHRGASAVEYLIAILLVVMTGAGVYKRFGPAIKCRMMAATNSLNGDEAQACNDASGSNGSGSGSGSGGSGSGDGTGGNSGPVAANDAPKGDPSGGGCPGGSCMVGGGNGCFPAGTTVRTLDGLRAIETVTPGTLVLTRAQEDGDALEWKPVVKAWSHDVRGGVRLELADDAGHDEIVEPTIDHPFHVDGRGWVAAEQLAPGVDHLRDQDGRVLQLVSAEEFDGVRPVYNFTVADDHTYYVGDLGVWVHNGNCDPTVIASVVNNNPSALGVDPATLKLIQDNGLEYDHGNGNVIFLKSNQIQQPTISDTEKDNPPYWYRSMPAEEFQALQNDPNNKVPEPPPKSFGGVSNSYQYSSDSSKGYWTNNGPNSVLVEFHAPDLYPNMKGNGVNVKGEGGGTYGLGPKGTQPPPKKKPKRNAPPPPNVSWQTFNGQLQSWRVVGLRIPNKIPINYTPPN